MRSRELKIPPLLVWFVIGGAMFGAGRLLPSLSFAMPARRAIAIALAAIGLAVAIAGVAAFRRQGTTVNPLEPNLSTSIVSTGVYGFSRNPMYLGFLLTLVGWAVWLANAGAALLLPAFVAYMNAYQIRPEERILLAKFGAEYERYMARVRRWI